MTFCDSASGDEKESSLDVEAFGEVAMDPLQQRLDGVVPMVPSHVGVQVEPQSLDPILVGAVRRQEVESQSIAELGQPRLRHSTLLDLALDVDLVGVDPALSVVVTVVRQSRFSWRPSPHRRRWVGPLPGQRRTVNRRMATSPPPASRQK